MKCRWFSIIAIMLVFAAIGSAASLCVNGNTLAQYITSGTCSVSAGPIDLLFSFNSLAMSYNSDSPTFTLTNEDITIYTVSGPGNYAGLTFVSSLFTVPADAFYADINLTFLVQTDPLGNVHYKLGSAHLATVMSLNGGTSDVDTISLGESELMASAFNLQQALPDTSSDITDWSYMLRTKVKPNTDLFISQDGDADPTVTSFTETFDVVHSPEPGPIALIGGGLAVLAVFRSRRLAKLLAVVLGVIVLGAPSQASTLCSDTNTIARTVANVYVAQGTQLNLASYISFGECQINDMLFTITSFSASHTGAAVTPAAGNSANPSSSTGNAIMVDIVNLADTPNVAQLTGGFHFLPVATTFSSSTLNYSIQFTVQAPTYGIFNYNGSTGGNLASVTRLVSITNCGGVTCNGGTASPSIDFGSNPLTTVYTVTDQVSLGNSAHVSSQTDQFAESVPEPLTATLVGGALLALGLAARKRPGKR